MQDASVGDYVCMPTTTTTSHLAVILLEHLLQGSLSQRAEVGDQITERLLLDLSLRGACAYRRGNLTSSS